MKDEIEALHEAVYGYLADLASSGATGSVNITHNDQILLPQPQGHDKPYPKRMIAIRITVVGGVRDPDADTNNQS